MTNDNECGICGRVLEEHAPYVVWHTGWDGCEDCDYDYEHGKVVCADCIEALEYFGYTFAGNTYVAELPFVLHRWACDMLWHAVWMPGDLTVGEADCARRYLDHAGYADADPAWDALPSRWWDTPDEFKASGYATAFLRRFGLGEEDLDRLTQACLGEDNGEWYTVVGLGKVGERLRKG